LRESSQRRRITQHVSIGPPVEKEKKKEKAYLGNRFCWWPIPRTGRAIFDSVWKVEEAPASEAKRDTYERYLLSSTLCLHRRHPECWESPSASIEKSLRHPRFEAPELGLARWPSKVPCQMKYLQKPGRGMRATAPKDRSARRKQWCCWEELNRSKTSLGSGSDSPPAAGSSRPGLGSRFPR
jgi:hypothetical protein